MRGTPAVGAACALWLALVPCVGGSSMQFEHISSYDRRLSILLSVAPDVHRELPLPLEDRLSSPCWQRNGSRHCLPAFFLAGAMQCGAGDLWQRLRQHALVPSRHDALSHWWTNHPRSRAGDFNTYVRRFSNEATLRAIEAEPGSLLGDASPATFTFIFAESLRLHYRYLDAFNACYAQCKGKNPPADVPACKLRLRASEGGYRANHCYAVAAQATAPLSFNIPSFAATILPSLKVIVLLREPAERLWIAYWNYGQYPARYGQSATGFAFYFGNQSADWRQCERLHGSHACALRFEGHGPTQADVYYHCDQLIKGMYSEFVGEWQVSIVPPLDTR